MVSCPPYFPDSLREELVTFFRENIPPPEVRTLRECIQKQMKKCDRCHPEMDGERLWYIELEELTALQWKLFEAYIVWFSGKDLASFFTSR